MIKNIKYIVISVALLKIKTEGMGELDFEWRDGALSIEHFMAYMWGNWLIRGQHKMQNMQTLRKLSPRVSYTF